MRTTPKVFRKLRALLRSRPLEWSSHVLSRLQSGERELRSEDDIVAILRMHPIRIVWRTQTIEVSYRTKKGLFTVVLQSFPEKIRIVTFMEEE